MIFQLPKLFIKGLHLSANIRGTRCQEFAYDAIILCIRERHFDVRTLKLNFTAPNFVVTKISHLTCTCSNSILETLKIGVKYVKNMLTIKAPERRHLPLFLLLTLNK